MNQLVVGSLFCDSYLRLAFEHVQSGSWLFRVRPKFHLVQHVFSVPRPSRVNVHRLYACWLDEDGNKKFMRVNRMVHKMTAPTRVLQRWLLALPRTFEKLSQENRCEGFGQGNAGETNTNNSHTVYNI